MNIVIPGKPIAQGRMRMGRGYLFDPQAQDKKDVRAMMEYFRPREMFKIPAISFFFHMPIPKSASKKEQFELKHVVVRHVKKPDIDNLVKFYLDCMDGIFFQGDQTVSLGCCAKIYAEIPKTVICIEESGASITKDEHPKFFR